MAPLIALITSFITFRIVGIFGWEYFDHWQTSLQAGVAIMFLVTASAHWGKRRPDLIRMVPDIFPQKAMIVSITGYLEIVGAIAIMIPFTSRFAAIGLVILLMVMFPANVRAARHKLTIGGSSVPNLYVRTLLQLIFIAAVILASLI